MSPLHAIALVAALWASSEPPGGGAPAPVEDPEVASVSGEAIRASEVRRRAAGTKLEDMRAALLEAVDERLLAREAPMALGKAAVVGLDREQRARRLAAKMFDPARRCVAIPEPARRQHYAETRWRFVAPPAWVVDDLQLLCCRKPGTCRDDPKVAACIDEAEPRAKALAAKLTASLSSKAFEEVFERARAGAGSGEDAGLAFKRYTFYFDPAHPDTKVDWRLQTVDAPIAAAVATLAPGEVAGPVRSRFGWHILRLDATRPGVDLTWDDPRTQALLATELCPAFLLGQREQYLSDLRRASDVRVDPKAFAEAFGGPWSP